MDYLISTVVVCEENKTRAELYALWLDAYDVQVAVTEREADEAISGTTAVVVLDQAFGDDAAETILERCRSRAPVCRVVGMRERSAAFPELNVEHQLVKPIFREELNETVERLAIRANYQLALRLYYQTTVHLSTFEMRPGESDAERARYERLEARAEGLKTTVLALQERLSKEDIIDIRHSISFEKGRPEPESREKIGSKYRPDRCSRCGADWERTARADESEVRKLGAYVWQCGGCGHVQMGTDPSHQNIGSYRR
jgi:hypothetical protein